MTTKITNEERARLANGGHISPLLSMRLLDAVKEVEVLQTHVEDAEAACAASRAFADALSRATTVLRVKVAKYIDVTHGEDCSTATWDAYEDMRIALGAFASNDEVRDWEADLFASESEVATLRAQVDAYAARAEADVPVLRARKENADAETRLLHGEIEMLRAQVAKLREALRNLLDEQNGPPLHRRRVEWEWASDNAELSLANTAPNGGEK